MLDVPLGEGGGRDHGLEFREQEFAHADPVHDLDRAAIAGADLHEIGETDNVFRGIGSGRVEGCGIEENRVAFFQLDLNMVFLKIGPELFARDGEIARHIAVREGQKLGRAAFERHVAMGHGALKRQGGGKLVDMGRILDELRGTLESHVVIAMGCLGFATRIDNIDLRGDLVERAEPCPADQADNIEGIIAGEGFR